MSEEELRRVVEERRKALVAAAHALATFRNARDYPGRKLGFGFNTCAHSRSLRVPCWECDQ
jgi:hypothetical protein